jgi:hypothetical protein
MQAAKTFRPVVVLWMVSPIWFAPDSHLVDFLIVVETGRVAAVAVATATCATVTMTVAAP